MKIILDIASLRPPLTGIGNYAAELAQRLPHAQGIEQVRYLDAARFVPTAPDGALPRLPTTWPRRMMRNILITPLRERLTGHNGIQQLYLSVLEQRQRRLLRPFKDDIFLTPNYYLPPVAGPGVSVFHDLSLFKHPEWHLSDSVAMGNFLLERTLRRADHIIVDAETIRRELSEHTGYPVERITTIPLGVDPVFHPRKPDQVRATLAKYQLSPGAYLLSVATIEPRKNLPALLDAHARLPATLRSLYPLVFAGAHGWKSAGIHAKIESAQREGRARYLTYVAKPDLPALVAGARLAAQPSFYEGFGLPTLEAMASGIPLVTSTCPTLVELTGGLALAVDPLDTDALTAALQQGLEDDTWRADIRARALERASRYTWDACIARTVETLAAVRP